MTGESMKKSRALKPLAIPSVAQIVRRYADGESIQALAKECGRSRRTLYTWMLTDQGGKRYRELVTQALAMRVADASEALENAKTMLEVIKASAQGDFARMDLERRRPELYGRRRKVEHSGPKPVLSIIITHEAAVPAEARNTQPLTIEQEPAKP